MDGGSNAASPKVTPALIAMQATWESLLCMLRSHLPSTTEPFTNCGLNQAVCRVAGVCQRLCAGPQPNQTSGVLFGMRKLQGGGGASCIYR